MKIICVNTPNSDNKWPERFRAAGYNVEVRVMSDELTGKSPTDIFLDDVAVTFVESMGYDT